ncbi:hypothetical protein [Coraliomargarita parva]|uniref:hypothetical protein n=1 Tax=Coraliomargarita parva TaxID=3014050 RepID=UPI0022B3FE08|nr:hypothetical protein [Coraliomargarita parva]
MKIVAEDQQVSLENITEITSENRFLIVKSKHKNGRYYRSVVYAGSILLLTESPRRESGRALRRTGPPTCPAVAVA